MKKYYEDRKVFKMSKKIFKNVKNIKDDSGIFRVSFRESEISGIKRYQILTVFTQAVEELVSAP